MLMFFYTELQCTPSFRSPRTRLRISLCGGHTQKGNGWSQGGHSFNLLGLATCFPKCPKQFRVYQQCWRALFPQVLPVNTLVRVTKMFQPDRCEMTGICLSLIAGKGKHLFTCTLAIGLLLLRILISLASFFQVSFPGL